MTDIVDKATRSRMMSGIRGKDTKPEMLVRKALFARGFRYRLHDKNLPGKPDMVFSCYKAVILVNGCFWHGHDCHLFRVPSSNTAFWDDKIAANRANDELKRSQLLQMGWKVLTVWECSLKGKSRIPLEELVKRISGWLPERDGCRQFEITGQMT